MESMHRRSAPGVARGTPPLSRIGRRMFLDGLGQSDRPARDRLPVIEVEVVENPRADEPGEQPEEHDNGDDQLHARTPRAEGRIREANHGSRFEAMATWRPASGTESG